MRNYLLALCLLVLPLHGYAEAKKQTDPFHALVIGEAAGLLMASVVAERPEKTGDILIGLSPLTAVFGVQDEENQWLQYSLGVAFQAGIGAWFKSMEGEERSEVKKKIFLGYNAILIPAFLLAVFSDEEQKGDDAAAQNSSFALSLDHGRQQALLHYTVRF